MINIFNMKYFLRKVSKPLGFYKEKNLFLIKNNQYLTFNNSKIKHISNALRNELNSINCLILKHLTCSSKSPVIRCKCEPSNQLIQYLIKRYQLTSKFKTCCRFLSEHLFKIKRFFNEDDYCTILENDKGEKFFKMKLTKPRKLIFYSDQYLKKNVTKFKFILHLEFIVDEKKISKNI
jgi:hypothetical protein